MHVLEVSSKQAYELDREAYLDYLVGVEAWAAIDRFGWLLDERIDLLRRQPELYPEDAEYPGTGYRSCYLAPHFRLFYRFDATQLVLLRLWDTRQNPAERLLAID